MSMVGRKDMDAWMHGVLGEGSDVLNPGLRGESGRTTINYGVK